MNHKSLIVKTIVLLLAMLVIAGCGGAESRKAKYLAKGKAYIEEKNYDKAKIEIKNALQIDPKHAEGYYLMGTVEEARQNWQQAFGNYSKAVELDPGHLEAYAKVGRLQLFGGNAEAASKVAEEILAKQPGHLAGRLLNAAVKVVKNDLDGAQREAAALVDEDPTRTEAVSLLASIYFKQQKQDKAIETVLKGIAASPKSIPLRVQLVNLYGQDQKHMDKIEPLIQEVISLEPDNLGHRRSMATFYAQTNQPDKAEATLREAIRLAPEDPDRYLLLAEYLAVRKNVLAAVEELQAAIKANPEAYKLHFNLAKTYEAVDAFDKATQIYRDVISADGRGKDGLMARNRLADLLLKQQKRDEAGTLTEEVLKENPRDNDALVNRARLAMFRNDPETAITSLRQVLRDQPGTVNVSSLLATAHLQKKETELAREVLLKTIEVNPKNAQARLAYARFLAQAKDIDGALKVTGEALKFAPDDLEILLTRMELLAAKRDTKGVAATISAIREKHPNKSVGYFHMGRYYASQKRYDDAVREFEMALSRSGFKDSFQTLNAIVSTHVAQGKPELALNRLQEILKEKPDHLFAHELLAEVYIVRKQYAEAEKSLNDAIKYNPTWSIPYRNLANLYLMRNNTSAAAEVYQKGLTAVPDDPQLLLYVAEMYERTRDYDKAISAYEHALKKDPEQDLAANNLAAILADHKTDAASLKRARELALRFEKSGQPNLLDTLGWVYYKSGENDKAVEVLKEVVKQVPNVPIFRYHLGMAYHKQGNMAEAKVHLARAVDVKDEYPGLVEARETLKKIQ